MLHWFAMSPGGSRRPFFAVMAVALAVMVGVLVRVFGRPAALPRRPPGWPSPSRVDQPLSLLTDPISVTVSGELPVSLVGADLVVHLEGPAELSQIGGSPPALPEAAQSRQRLGPTPTTSL